MRKGYRRFLAVVVVSLIFAISVWAMIYDFAVVSRSYDRVAADASRYYANQAEREIAVSCNRLSPRLQKECASSADASARENQRAEQELAAQKVTAWWTKIMGAAALIGMGISTLGVVLVWTTFREQRRATNLAHEEAERAKTEALLNAKDAQEALSVATRNADAAAEQVRVSEQMAERQLRAYVLQDSFSFRAELDEENVRFWELKILWKNSGRTPARDLVSHRSVAFHDGTISDDFPFQDGGEFQKIVRTIPPEGSIGTSWFRFTIPQLMAIKEGKLFCRIYGWAEYNDVFSDTPRRRSEFSFELVIHGTPTMRKCPFSLTHTARFNGYDENAMHRALELHER